MTAAIVDDGQVAGGVGAGLVAGPIRVALADAPPLVAGLVPFAMAVGTASAAAGFSSVETVGGALLLLAGAAQLATIELLGADAGVLIAVGTALLINVRFVLYGAALSRWFEDMPRWQQLLLAIPVVDQTFIMCERRFTAGTDSRWRRSYYLTLTAALVCSFVACELIGYQVGSTVPGWVGLQLAAPLVFAGMLGVTVSERAQLATAMVAGVLVLAAEPLSSGAALPVAAVAGIVVGSLISTDGREESK